MFWLRLRCAGCAGTSQGCTRIRPDAQRSYPPPRWPRLTNLPGQWLQCQANGSNVPRSATAGGRPPLPYSIWARQECSSDDL